MQHQAVIDTAELKQIVEGSLLGLMVGDALGLPYEGMSPGRVKKFLKGDLKHALIMKRGLVSDDTEHAVMTATSLIRHWGAWDRFERGLAWQLRWWLIRLPAGVGLATARATIKLWLGFSGKNSGVYSAGNGPAMRAPIIGVCLGCNLDLMRHAVKASTFLTHTDPKATVASLAVAQAAFMAARRQPLSICEYRITLQSLFHGEDESAVAEFEELLNVVVKYLDRSPEEFAEAMGLKAGVSGYCYHTVPVVLFLWFKYQADYKSAIESVINLGGDTDTTAAILGGILGASVGRSGIPEGWRLGVADWPMSASYLESLAELLVASIKEGKGRKVSWLPGPLLFLRNMVFLAIVLAHGFRRLLPPY